jgi:hypothetical protein
MFKREKFIPPSRDKVFIWEFFILARRDEVFIFHLVEAASVAKIPSRRDKRQDHINTL